MDPVVWLLSPGEWLHGLMFGPLAYAGETEGEVVVALGLLFWAMVFVAAGVAWRLRAPIERRSARIAAPMQARMPAIVGKAGELLTRVDSWSLRDAWSVVWRAEAAHLILYVLLPLAIAAWKLALFADHLPFSAMSFADRPGPLFRIEPLDRPVCWTFASWCPTPFARYRGLTEKEAAQCRPAKECPTRPIVSADPAQAALKFGWFALALAWIVAWHRRGRRPRNRAT